MNTSRKALTAKPRSAAAIAALAFRGLFLGIGLAIFTSFLEMIDSFADGLADLLFEDET